MKRILVSPVFILYAVCVGVMTSWKKCICAVIALMIHETGHYAAAKLFGERIERLIIAPFGGVMECNAEQSGKKGFAGVCIAAAGPLANYMIILLLTVMKWPAKADWMREMLIANLSLLAINLLPVIPLDGGKVLFSLLYYVMGVGLIGRILSAAGVLLGVGMVLLGVYGWAFFSTINLSVFIVGFYIAIYAWRGKESLLIENRYAVLQERQMCRSGARVTIRMVDRTTPLIDVIRWMDKKERLLFLSMDEHAAPLLIGERCVIQTMLQEPGADFSRIMEKGHSLQTNAIIYTENNILP